MIVVYFILKDIEQMYKKSITYIDTVLTAMMIKTN